MVDTKRCSKCKETKSVEEFNKNRSTKDGLQHYCKSCHKERAKQYRQENRERLAKKQKQYYRENREKIIERRRQYQQENKDDYLEYFKIYRQENREKISEIQKRYYRKNRDYYTEYSKLHRQKNKDHYAAKAQRERAIKRSAIPDHLLNCEVERQRLVDIYALRRIISEATGVEHHVDHMWPLSKGGPHWSGNLQIITAEENLAKNASVDEELIAAIQSALDEDVERYRRHGKDGSTRH